MIKALIAAAALLALAGPTHADQSENTYFSSAAVVKSAVDGTIKADFVKHNHTCGVGYCADEYIDGGEAGNGGAHGIIDYAYVIQPQGHAPYYSYCELNGDKRTCWTSLGKAWVDIQDGKGGWTTVQKIREHFPVR
jgi:hypothetical protein